MNRFLCLTSLILLVFLAGLSLAGIPKMINYQGMLTDNSGTPLSGPYNLTFKIWTDTTGGSSLWDETHAVSVQNGLYNVILGRLTALNLPFDQQYWLEVQVGDETMPRLRFTSVGYAYRAQNADTADYARGGGGGSGSPWIFRISDGSDTTITTGGGWGVARFGNQLFGNADSTHVNLGVACTTGTSGQNYKYCTVGGGWSNIASGYSATVGGGERNTASGGGATVGGGRLNIANGGVATVAGGVYDTASGSASTVGGGYGNTVSGNYATAGGGLRNSASANYAIVGGGSDNTAIRGFATVGGGYTNAASESSATVGGGEFNTASGRFATVGGGSNNTASGSDATVGGGYNNIANVNDATVGGGYSNTASGGQATVGGGYVNTASNYGATVGGGIYSTASESYAIVGGGYNNTASGYSATVGGGMSNTASGSYAAVGSGWINLASGDYSAIPGGFSDTITSNGDYSMIFGRGVYVNNSYRVVFFDGSSSGRLGINRDDRNGGISYPIHVGTGTGNGNGAYLTNGGVWTNGSSRTFKENFQSLNSRELLEKISSMPVEAWNYKNSDERHIGPVAEDFVSAFDVGTIRDDGIRDNKYLSAEDIAGVALAGVKELINENQELKQTIEKLSQRIAELEKIR